ARAEADERPRGRRRCAAVGAAGRGHQQRGAVEHFAAPGARQLVLGSHGRADAAAERRRARSHPKKRARRAPKRAVRARAPALAPLVREQATAVGDGLVLSRGSLACDDHGLVSAMGHGEGDPKKVVVAALLGNAGIALAKFVAAFLSGSATMLAE